MHSYFNFLVVAHFYLLLCVAAAFSGFSASRGGPGTGPPDVDSDLDLAAARAQQFQKLIAQAGVYTDFPPPHPQCNSTDCPMPKVGILGAGISGLYAALLLQSVGIDYEILEADNRIGGRIYTHYFDPEAWQQATPADPEYYNYYDVGAMRIPASPYMDRVIGPQNWSIVSYVNSHVNDTRDRIDLIPYIFSANGTFALYNDILVPSNVTPSAATFGVLTTEGGDIPPSNFAQLNPTTVFNDALADLMNALQANFDTGYAKLMEYDQLSVRDYLLQQNFTNMQIDWLETINDATSYYDRMSISQAVIEQWIFNTVPIDQWRCVNGGMAQLINGVLKVIQTQPQLNQRVTAIAPGPEDSLTVVVNHTSEHTYSHVINTLPLSATTMLDTSTLTDLPYNSTMAWRTLAYDSAGKIGMQFRTRWWEDPTIISPPIIGGQSFTDRPMRRCVYPSYGLNMTDAPGAMIASYVWSQDSDRLGAFYETPSQRALITQSVLRDLAHLHNISVAFLTDQLVDIHFWDFYLHGYTDGAYALFGPAEFSDILPYVLRPNCKGRLHTAGEATSSGHAWIVGAMNAAYRSVMEVLSVENRTDLMEDVVRKWAVVDEVDLGWFTS